MEWKGRLKQNLLDFVARIGCVVVITTAVGCATQSKEAAIALSANAPGGRDANRLLIVDCLLPGQLRSLGKSMTFMTPRRPLKTSASECEIRGGEYVAYDRANFSTSLKIWLPKAKAGDAEAQTFVGEIFEKGLGQLSDPQAAADWYLKAAGQGNTRAQINLGYLYESGLGVERNLVTAMNYYRAAAGFDDSNLEYVTSLEVASRKAREQKAVDMEKEIAVLQAANAKLLSQREKFDQQQARLKNLEREIDEKRVQITSLVSQRRSDTSPSVGQSVQTESVAGLVTEIADLDSRLKASQKQNGTLLEQLTRQQEITSSLRKQVAESDSELSQARSQLVTQVQRVTAIESRLQADEETKEVKQQLTEELSIVRADVLDKKKLITVLRQRQTEESRRQDTLLLEAEQKENTLKAALDDARERIEKLNKIVSDKEIAYQQQLAQVREIESESATRLLRKQREISDLQKRVSQLQAMDVVNQTAINDANQQITRLTNEVVVQRAEVMDKIDITKKAELAAIELAELEDQLAEQKQLSNTQQSKIESLERDVANQRATLPRAESVERVATSVVSGPMIEIIEPPVTVLRGAFAIPVPTTTNTLELIGKVTPADQVISFKVNGSRRDINNSGVFTYDADIQNTTQLTLTAVDDQGERAELKLSLVGEAIAQARAPAVVSGTNRGAAKKIPVGDIDGIEFGKYHALIIGNQNYDQFSDLRTSINDVLEIERVLRKKYGFATELLQNASRYQILAALNRKRDELTEDDNLLIYFAGHGELADGKGYWLPVDSEPDSTDNWISSLSITDLVDSMSAKHVMIVADSCYSGTLSRTSVPRLRKELPAEQKLQWYENVSRSKVRTVLTSGGVRPVIDGLQGSRHSIFAEAFIDELASGSGVVEAYTLFLNVQERVIKSASSIGMVQDPRYSPIQFAGHESGEFLFVGSGG